MENYYKAECDKVRATEYAATIIIRCEGGSTRYLNINAASLPHIVDALTRLSREHSNALDNLAKEVAE